MNVKVSALCLECNEFCQAFWFW